jgi:hypothetical protein
VDERLTRRTALLAAGGAVAAVAIGGCGGDDGGETTAAECVLTPEQTEGPYYVDDAQMRRDITEGRPGTPLALTLSVVSAASCRPIGGAAVDIWHCDALGVYSGVEGDGGTFMRGVQRTDAKGVARFDTVYPGWYSGRAVHIHVKVHVDGDEVHTGQLYFPEDATAEAYDAEPYSTRPGPDVSNSEDGIYASGSDLRITRAGDGWRGAITMGVRA